MIRTGLYFLVPSPSLELFLRKLNMDHGSPVQPGQVENLSETLMLRKKQQQKTTARDSNSTPWLSYEDRLKIDRSEDRKVFSQVQLYVY